MAFCRGCKKEILFIKTAGGRMHPVDLPPIRFELEEGGTDKIVTGSGEVVIGLIKDNGTKVGYVSHFATCPQAEKFRRK